VFGRATITLGTGPHSSSFFFPSPNLRLDVCHTHTWCGLSANLECRSEKCCTRLAENTGRKKIAKNLPSGHHCTTLSGYIFATKALIDSRKKLVKQQYLLQMANFGPRAAEIGSVVCGTPSNFNWFRVLAALLHGI